MAIPTSIRLPLVWVEAVERARASDQSAERGLLIGPASTATTGPYLVQSVDAAIARWGRGTPIVEMVRAALDAHPKGEWWAIGQPDPSSGSAAYWTSTLSGSATASGTVRLWIGRRRYSIAVASGDTAATVATAIQGAIEADSDAPVTVSVATATITLTARVKGVIGGSLRIAWDEATIAPTGLTLGDWSATAGTGDHALPSLPPVPYNKIAIADDALMDDLGAVLDARWSYSSMLWGWGVSCVRGEADTLATAALAAEYQYRHMTRCAIETACRSSPWEVAAAVCGVAMLKSQSKPGITVSGDSLALEGPAQASWTGAQQDTLLRYGVSPVVGRTLTIARITTTRWSDGNGGRDERSYQAPQMWALEVFLRRLTAAMRATFRGRRLLADSDYTPPDAATPGTIRSWIESWLKAQAADGIIEWRPDLLEQITVTRSEDDPSRVDIYLPVDLVDGLEVLAAEVAY